MYRVEIDHLPPSLNAFFAGKHWTARKAIVDEWTELFLYAFHDAKLPRILPEKLSLNVTQFCKGKVRDADNAVVGAKLCSDSLVKLGYIKDDNLVKPIILNTEKGKENKIVITIQ